MDPSHGVAVQFGADLLDADVQRFPFLIGRVAIFRHHGIDRGAASARTSATCMPACAAKVAYWIN